jgi:DDE_Tnp_1-associated
MPAPPGSRASHLLASLATIPDPRSALGRRHRLVAILALAAAAVLAGARSFAAIAEWATDAPQPVRAALGARRDAPDHWAVPAEATIRRTLGRLDANTLAAAVGAWLADRQRHDRSRAGHAHRQRAVAVDGKTLRAPAPPPATAARCTCWRRWTTPAARCWPNTRSAAPPRRSPACGRCWPASTSLAWWSPPTPSTPTRSCRVPGRRQQAHYLLQVKANQPTLLARCTGLPWHRVPVLDRTRDRGHGRIEVRTLKAVTVHHLGFPHAAQVIQVTRKRTVGGSQASTRRRRWQTVTVSAITSLGFAQASPARLADLLRGHWAIEALHHLRDTTFAEDACKGSAPVPAPRSWRPCPTWPSACSAGPGRSTSPPPCATTPATPPGPWPPSPSPPA